MTWVGAAFSALSERFGDSGLVLGLLGRGMIVLAAFWAASAVCRKARARLRHEVVLAGLLLAMALPVVVLLGEGGAFFLSFSRPPAFDEPALPRAVATEIRQPAPELASPRLQRKVVSSTAGLKGAEGAAAVLELPAKQLELLPFLWSIGMGSILAVWAVRWAVAYRRLLPWRPVPERWAPLIQGAALGQGLRGEVRLSLSKGAPVPLVWGLLRPRVVLPLQAADWEESRLNVALRHEFAHLVRRDHLTRVVGNATVLFHWPNPLAWLVRARLCLERELSCDQAVIAGGVTRSRYARELLDMVLDLSPQRQAPGQLLMAGTSQIKQRIERALEAPTTSGPSLRLPRFVTVLAVGVLALLVSSVYAAPKTDGAPPGVAAAERLEAMGGGDLQRLAIALRHGDWQGLQGGGRLSVPRRAVTPLLGALGDPDPRVRRIAAWALGETRSRRGRQALRTTLMDADAAVRAAAAQALGDVGGLQAMPDLLQALQDSDPRVRRRAAHALGDLRHPGALEALVSALGDEEEEVAREVDWALRETLDVLRVPGLLLALGHREARVRFHAAHFLGDAADRAAVAALVDRLEDPDPETRIKVAWALGEISDAGSLDGLARIAVEIGEPTELRTMAIRGMGEIRDRRAGPVLAELLGDDQWRVRSQAADALGTLRGRGYRDLLEATAAGDPNSDVREVAAKAARRSK